MALRSTVDDIESKEDKLEDVEEEFATSWSDPNWFRMYPLHHNSIYDYFMNSPFYDNRCSNAIVTANQLGGDFQAALKELKGTEYKVDFETRKKDAPQQAHEYTTYNVIYKHDRLSPTQLELERVYYCPGADKHPQFGSIFPMPPINTVFNNKMRNAVYHLNQAMQGLQSKSFDEMLKNETSRKKKKKSKKQQKKEKQNQAQRNQYSSLVDGLIMDMQK